MPFSSLTENQFNVIYQNKFQEKIQKIKNQNSFLENCSVCTKKVRKKQKSIPCSCCKSLIHINCSNKANLITSYFDILTWFCPSCIGKALPFMEIDDHDLNKLQNQKHESIVTKLQTNELTKIFNFNEKINEENELNTINCNYYDIDEFKTLVQQQVSNDNFSILHTNISSIQGNFEKLELLLNQINMHKFDVISLTETWNPDSKKHLFIQKSLSGYQQYIGQSGTTMKSGCGFYISNDINYIPRTDLDTHFYNQANEFSCKWIEVINKQKTNVIIASVYRHPSKNDTAFLEYINNTLLKIKKEGKYILITGDFNYNLLKHDKDNQVEQFLGIMLSHFCQPHIVYPTRVVDNAKPSLVDNIFLNTIEHNPLSGNLTSKITDHMPNFLICQKFNKNITNKVKRKKRDFSKFNEADFITDMNNFDFVEKIKHTNNTNIKFNILNENMLRIFNQHAPIRELSNRETKNLLKPWISPGILNSIKVKNKFYSKYVKSLDPFWYLKYKTYRDRLNHLIRTSKNMHYREYFRKFRTNCKKTWTGIRTFLSNKKLEQTSVNLQQDGEIITDQKIVANKFNEFFVSVGLKLSEKIPESTISFTDYLKNPSNTSMFLLPTDPKEILSLIQKLDETKSTDLYETSIKLLKLSGACLSDVISDIINHSFVTGIFPDKLKSAFVLPVHQSKL